MGCVVFPFGQHGLLRVEYLPYDGTRLKGKMCSVLVVANTLQYNLKIFIMEVT